MKPLVDLVSTLPSGTASVCGQVYPWQVADGTKGVAMCHASLPHPDLPWLFYQGRACWKHLIPIVSYTLYLTR